MPTCPSLCMQRRQKTRCCAKIFVGFFSCFEASPSPFDSVNILTCHVRWHCESLIPVSLFSFSPIFFLVDGVGGEGGNVAVYNECWKCCLSRETGFSQTWWKTKEKKIKECFSRCAAGLLHDASKNMDFLANWYIYELRVFG